MELLYYMQSFIVDFGGCMYRNMRSEPIKYKRKGLFCMYENKCVSVRGRGEHNETSYHVNTKLAKLDRYALNIYNDYEHAFNEHDPVLLLLKIWNMTAKHPRQLSSPLCLIFLVLQKFSQRGITALTCLKI